MRPSWICSACGEPWPCAPARAALVLGFDRRTLAMHLVDRMIEAARDIPTTSPADLYERFLSWTRGPYSR